MSSSRDPLLASGQAAYLRRLLRRRPAAGAAAGDAGASAAAGDPAVAALLEVVARAVAARRLLVVAAEPVPHAVALARALPEAAITALGREPADEPRARAALAGAGVADRVELSCGEPVTGLARLAGPFQLVYLAGDGSDYRRCLDLALQLMPVGGAIAVDHLMWRGRVAEPGAEDDPVADAMAAFNGYFMIHPQLAATLLPVADGVGVAVKKAPLVTDVGGPF